MNKHAFYIKMLIGSLARRRSRMLTALLAVAIGATILSGLCTIYYDIPRQMGQEFRSYGANLVFIPSGGDALTMQEIDKAASYLPQDSVVGVAPYSYHTVKINERPFMAAGTVLAEAKKTSPYWLVKGKWPEKPGQVLIGQEVADVIRLLAGSSFTMSGTDAGGKSFNHDFAVSGIVQTGGMEEAFIFMSLEDFSTMMGESVKLDAAECSVSLSGGELENVISQISSNVPGLTPRPVKRVTESEVTVLGKLQALVYLVTVVVLLLTMICVATTMLAVVAERRKEIGLKKALGAANNSIIKEFLGEGALLGGVGGLLGVICGFAFAQMISVNVFGRPLSFQPLLLPVTVTASVAVTCLSCMLSVKSAVGVDPAIVLRGE